MLGRVALVWGEGVDGNVAEPTFQQECRGRVFVEAGGGVSGGEGVESYERVLVDFATLFIHQGGEECRNMDWIRLCISIRYPVRVKWKDRQGGVHPGDSVAKK